MDTAVKAAMWLAIPPQGGEFNHDCLMVFYKLILNGCCSGMSL